MSFSIDANGGRVQEEFKDLARKQGETGQLFLTRKIELLVAKEQGIECSIRELEATPSSILEICTRHHLKIHEASTALDVLNTMLKEVRREIALVQYRQKNSTNDVVMDPLPSSFSQTPPASKRPPAGIHVRTLQDMAKKESEDALHVRHESMKPVSKRPRKGVLRGLVVGGLGVLGLAQSAQQFFSSTNSGDRAATLVYGGISLAIAAFSFWPLKKSHPVNETLSRP